MTTNDDDEDRDENQDDDRDDENGDEAIEFTEVTGTVTRYDPQFGVILLSDGTLVMLSEPPAIAIQPGMTLWVRGQEVDQDRILAEQISVQPFEQDDDGDQGGLPPVIVDVTGRVQSYDPATGVLQINAMTAILVVRPTFAITPGMIVTVSGELLPDGRILVDVIAPVGTPTPPTNPTSQTATICHIPPAGVGSAYTITVEISFVAAHLAHGDYLGPCSTPASPAVQLAGATCPAGCDPLLLTLSDALGVPYNSLAALQSQGYNSGVIARVHVIAQAAGVPVDEVLARYNSGEDWESIRRAYGLFADENGGDAIVIGNGRGYSIREDYGGGWFGGGRG